MTHLIQQTAQIVFGISSLHKMQKIVIEDILLYTSRHSALASQTTQQDDVQPHRIVLLPTGAGKSLCFMLPALLSSGPTLIIYPLLALMNDQERRLEALHIPYTTFRGGMTKEQKQKAFEKIRLGAKCIIANPEVLQNTVLLNQLAHCSISHIAIDEAHCVSEWGDTFRPAYLTLGTIIKKIAPKTVSAFTATASEPVLKRISQVLFDDNARVIQGDGDRQNIHYYTHFTEAKNKALLHFAITERRPLVIFCRTRKQAEQTAYTLALYFGNDIVRFYHAGLEKEEKKAVESFLFTQPQAIIATTCALGMGVDIPGIRTIIHLSPPPSVESYMQESGRAGRDGKTAKAILFWNTSDFDLIKKDTTGRMQFFIEYLQSTQCKRKLLLQALGCPDAENISCTGCSVCNTSLQDRHKQSDGDFAYSLIKRHQKQWSFIEASYQIQVALNRRDNPFYHKNVWDHKDVISILLQLRKEQKIHLIKTRFAKSLDRVTITKKKL
ncbi:MAG: RecQ family ATP-dependent DNA helicase [Treponema sp.]|nr:RecQ family ATP-dependent DNA helicase [Treponema sp.]